MTACILVQFLATFSHTLAVLFKVLRFSFIACNFVFKMTFAKRRQCDALSVGSLAK